MNTNTANQLPATTPLEQLGELYRDETGHEVWRIRDLAGNVAAEAVESDHDAAWIAGRIAQGK
jgi:hypothetical protein